MAKTAKKPVKKSAAKPAPRSKRSFSGGVIRVQKTRETFIAHFEELKRDILACAPTPMTVAINPHEYTIGGVKKTLEGHYDAVFSPQ